MIRPIIEVYFDPNGTISALPGCWRARLQDCHGCHGAGRSSKEAIESVVITANSFCDLRDKTGNLQFAHLPYNIVGYTVNHI